MAEKETDTAKEQLKRLPDSIVRQLIVVGNRTGLQLRDFDDWIIKNQAQFGKGTEDYVAMVEAHQNSSVGLNVKVLGVKEEVRKRRMVIGEYGTETEFIEANPKVKNVWVGKYVELMTPEKAASTPYSGQNALYWATVNNVVPEMVVKANNGYFYPATKKDVIMPPKNS